MDPFLDCRANPPGSPSQPPPSLLPPASTFYSGSAQCPAQSRLHALQATTATLSVRARDTTSAFGQALPPSSASPLFPSHTSTDPCTCTGALTIQPCSTRYPSPSPLLPLRPSRNMDKHSNISRKSTTSLAFQLLSAQSSGLPSSSPPPLPGIARVGSDEPLPAISMSRDSALTQFTPSTISSGWSERSCSGDGRCMSNSQAPTVAASSQFSDQFSGSSGEIGVSYSSSSTSDSVASQAGSSSSRLYTKSADRPPLPPSHLQLREIGQCVDSNPRRPSSSTPNVQSAALSPSLLGPIPQHRVATAKRAIVSDSISSSPPPRETRSPFAPNKTETGNSPRSGANDDVMDIESCIDNPVLAPLGRHVNKRKSSSRRRDEDHIDINVMPQTSSSAFIQERERESHSPVTSLILRRRRLDCEQLSQYLQNLQPAFDPLTMSILRTPLLHLTELDLSRNRLVSLPKDLTAMVPHLSYLNLSHNQFADVPLELCRLTNLQVLIMSQNRIQGPFPHQICSSLTQLKNLRLCANEITSLPHTMARLDKLESLSMGSVYGGNLLTTFPANCIQHMKALRELDLSHNKLCLLPADIGHPHSHLRQLSASDNKLEAIPKSIGYCRELRSLILGRNQLTSLPTEIADLMQLDTLDLSENLLCVIPGDVADFLTKTTLLLTGNPFTRGYCDANRNPVGEIGGLGIHHPTMDDDRYATLLKSLSRRAILNSAASSSSSAGNGSLPTMASFGGVGIGGAGGAGWAGSSQGSGMPSPGLSSGRESPRFGPSHTEGGYEMDHDERLDYHLYYTRHALSSSSRPPSRAESINSVNEFGGGTGSDYGSVYGGSWMDPFGSGTGASTPRVNAEAVIADIDAFFEFLPAIPSRAEASRTGSVAPPTRAGSGSNLTTTTTISLNTTQTEPSIFEGTSLLASPSSTVTSPLPLQQLDAALNNIQLADPLSVSPRDQADVSQNDTQQAGVESSVNMDPETPAALFEAPVRSFFPSLQELAARAVLFHGEPLPLELLPEMVIDYLQPGARPCGLCRQPYVKEWVSSVRVKSYLGHPAVARRVRFCSFMCWKQASEQLEAEEANEGSSLLGMPVVQPGQITGHLPPVVMSALYDETGEKILRNNTMGRDRGSVSSRSSVSSQEEEFSQLLTDSVLISPPLSSSTSSTASFPPPGSGMRVCKGGQTYWPVIGRQLRRASSSTSATTKTGVCARGCLGGGVCEW